MKHLIAAMALAALAIAAPAAAAGWSTVAQRQASGNIAHVELPHVRINHPAAVAVHITTSSTLPVIVMWGITWGMPFGPPGMRTGQYLASNGNTTALPFPTGASDVTVNVGGLLSNSGSLRVSVLKQG
jgi:hypothetical protein